MILDAVGDITFEVDLKRHTLLWQDRAWHWLSKEVPDTPVELSSVFRLLHPDDVDEFRLAFNRCISRGTAINQQARIRSSTGEYLVWRWRGRPIFGEDARPELFLGTISDVTAIIAERSKQANKTVEAERLQQALNKQLKINGLQRAFVSMVSHEFRTPLTVIKAAASLVRRKAEGITPERLVDKMTKIDASVDELVDQMESILMSGQLEAGQLDCLTEHVDLIQLLEEVIERITTAFPLQTFKPDLPEGPFEVTCDPVMIRRAAYNLLRNSAQFSPSGSVIALTLETVEDDTYQITIKDNGPGIPADELSFVFDRFYRGSTAGTTAGTGVGLSLVKSFVELHDGKVEVTNRTQHGTKVVLTLPTAGPSDKGKTTDEFEAE
ncbi:MAG: HAMP domain-containing sensor histidine kinase [Pseudomonadota bacterium]